MAEKPYLRRISNSDSSTSLVNAFNTNVSKIEESFQNLKITTTTTEISPEVYYTLKIGDTKALNFSSIEGVTFTYTSFDILKATVDSNGVVTGVAEGYVKITVTATKDGSSDTIIYISFKIVPGDAIDITTPENPLIPEFTNWIEKGEGSFNQLGIQFVLANGYTDEIFPQFSIKGNPADFPNGVSFIWEIVQEEFNGVLCNSKINCYPVPNTLNPTNAKIYMLAECSGKVSKV